MSRTPTWNSWYGMILRCEAPNSGSYSRYGARGIRVCKRWRRFENFLADMGERPVGKTLERRDPKKHYTPGNCTWATPVQQARNRRSTVFVVLDGERMCAKDAAARVGLNYSMVSKRLRSGWSVERALSQPSRKGRAA